MFEPGCTLLHKCLLNILPSAQLQGQNFLNSVLSTVLAQVQSDTGLLIPVDKALGNYSIETADRQHRLLMNYVPSLDSAYPVHWAIRLKSSDPTARYRVYSQHIGIRQTSAYELSVHIASTSTDYLGGRFADIHPPLKKVSPLVERLFSNPDIRCVTGNHILLSKSIRLTNQSIEFFLNLLFEKTRTLPVIMNSCPDIISPDLLHSLLLGNAIVFSSDDPGAIMLLNDYLPDSMRLPMGSIRIFLPLDTQKGAAVFHPLIPLSDVYRITPQEIINRLYRAYAENFRQQELRSFISIDTCAALRTQYHIANLKAQLISTRECLKISEDQLQQLQTEIDNLKNKFAEKGPESKEDIIESLLDEYSSELTLLKEGIQYLTSQSCGNSQIIAIPEGSHTMVIDLIKSVNFRQLRAKSRNNKKGK